MVSAELNGNQFHKISDLVYRYCGINLKEGKEALVRARLMKRLRALGLSTISEYLTFIESKKGVAELDHMIDVMTTNKTSFLREVEHFKFLQEEILSNFTARRMRIWSAACSSGQEPYSIALFLLETVPDIEKRDILVLGTDISNQMLEIARRGEYPPEVLADVPAAMRHKYFTMDRSVQPPVCSVGAQARNLVRLARLNLMDAWPMRGPFNVIFCRNVMIYFDRQTQQRLVNRFYDILEPGGYLMVGHSEGLSAIKHKFRYVRPATYKK